ncbi:MAG TPA: hypothetical protein ENI70_01100 [Candidatus Peregrinibacteria bacterium]|nr:hypothetical protein [Candidatus Peregrinibacteria bacterium]
MLEQLFSPETLATISEATDSISSLKQYWREGFTAILGISGVRNIIKGSKGYSDLESLDNEASKKKRITESAGGIFRGATQLMAATVLGGSPRYMLPEALATVMSGRTYARNRFEETTRKIEGTIGIDRIKDQIQALICAVLIMGGLAATGQFENWQDVLTPLGLSTLSVAFSMDTSTPSKERVFQILSIISGATITVGSAVDCVTNPAIIGKVISSLFFVLNVYFTRGAIENLCDIDLSPKRIFQGIFSGVRSSIHKIFGGLIPLKEE